MAADNYLGLVNRVLKPLNEVVLTSSNFLTAEGVYADARDAVNQGLFDVYTYKNVLWPFLFSETTFQTTEGTIAYSKPASVTKVDWSSFVVKRPSLSVSSLTRSSFTVTVTTFTAHNFVTGDYVEILGATPTDYNLDNVAITVTDSTTFTFTVDDDTLTSPATGTITVKSNTLTRRPLTYVDKDEYIKSYSSAVENATQDSYRKPEFVSRKPSNDFIIFYPPDRVYDISYSAYSVPSKLSAYNDSHSVPEQYEQAAIDKALHYMYMFRDNMEQAAIAAKRAEDRLEAMVRVLSPFSNNMVTP
jgi:hypothetical protein